MTIGSSGEREEIMSKTKIGANHSESQSAQLRANVARLLELSEREMAGVHGGTRFRLIASGPTVSSVLGVKPLAGVDASVQFLNDCY